MTDTNYPLISVIVPVYNVGAYLRRCVDSILTQTYPRLEIILVNDGSTDKSLQICREYESACPNVIVLDKPNGGLSSARNFGLKIASGEYIGFVDSDDWVSPDMYEVLYRLIKDNNVDAAQIGIKESEKFYMESQPESNEQIIIRGRDDILRYYLDSGTRQSGSYSVCRCLFTAEFAKKYRFREGKVNEDIDYKYRVLSECKSFAVSNRIGYYYFQSGDSISSGVLKKRDFDLYDTANELMMLAENETDKDIKFLCRVKKARTPFSLLCRIAYYGIDRNAGNKAEIVRRLTKELRTNIMTLLKAPLPLSRKLLALGLAINFHCVAVPISIIKIIR